MVPPHLDRGSDKYLWRNGADHFVPNFSSKATWHRIRETAPEVPWVDLIWFKEEIPRCSFVAWMAILSRLPTKDRLSSWGMNVQVQCVLCSAGQESHQHLFFMCPFVSAVWSHFSGSAWQDAPTSMLEVVDLIAASPRFRVVLKLLMQVIVYCIWRERNYRIFKQVATTEAGVISIVDRMIRDRLLSISPSRPQSPSLLQMFFSLSFRPP
ncbi:hypothetical protein Bca52824_019078 [Brassica carinata]|uniref:Reverse transcriptase zinc-binding domain-containing protein n=1 Tax=Brassica carinata TaxID=52824 RepID=A0A8X7VRB9_BRACI|nr:hypothetical protein Bca52824_019078 [Brassica carinata]